MGIIGVRLPSVVFLLVAISCSSEGAVLRVPSQYSTIQQAVDASAGGDTVLIATGSYVESIGWENKDLKLIGDDSPEHVIISMKSAGRAMLLGPGVTSNTLMRNLTIRDGYAEEGAGLKLVAASPVIQDCRFVSNVVANQDETSKGGAMFVDSGSAPLIENSVFTDNIADMFWPQVFPYGEGGGIYVIGSVILRSCNFEGNLARGFEGGAGGAVRLEASASATIDSCKFAENGGYGGGVYSQGKANITDSIFEGNFGWTGAAIMILGVASIDRNLFYNNEVMGTEGGTVVVYSGGAVTRNTIALNRGLFDYSGLYAPNSTMIARNIIALNEGWGSECPFDISLMTCNDVWGNSIGGVPADYHGCNLTGLQGNISADPQFCAPVVWDLRLNATSPCIGAACGDMGALGVGCTINGIDGPGTVASIPGELIITPNPIQGVARIKMVHPAEGKLLEVYDLQGRVVEAMQARGEEFTWTPSSLPRGVYFARLRGDGAARAVKVIITR